MFPRKLQSTAAADVLGASIVVGKESGGPQSPPTAGAARRDAVPPSSGISTNDATEMANVFLRKLERPKKPWRQWRFLKISSG